MIKYIYNQSKIRRSTNEVIIDCVKAYLKIFKPNITQDVIIKKDFYGKPYCNIDNIFISATHSANNTITVAGNKPIGIDFEEKNIRVIDTLKELFCDLDSEYEMISLWTKIESLSKLLGCGLTKSIDEFIELINSGKFSFIDIDVAENSCCSLCMINSLKEIKLVVFIEKIQK